MKNTKLSLRHVEIRGVRYLHVDDVATLLRELLKPVEHEVESLRAARLCRELDDHRAIELDRRLADLGVGCPAVRRKGLVGWHGDRSTVIAMADIDWIEAANYCAVVHVGRAVHVVRHSLAALEAELDPARFVRVHRGALVNLARIRKLHGAADKLVVILHGGARLSVSRRRREAIERQLLARPG